MGPGRVRCRSWLRQGAVFRLDEVVCGQEKVHVKSERYATTHASTPTPRILRTRRGWHCCTAFDARMMGTRNHARLQDYTSTELPTQSPLSRHPPTPRRHPRVASKQASTSPPSQPHSAVRHASNCSSYNATRPNACRIGERNEFFHRARWRAAEAMDGLHTRRWGQAA